MCRATRSPVVTIHGHITIITEKSNSTSLNDSTRFTCVMVVTAQGHIYITVVTAQDYTYITVDSTGLYIHHSRQHRATLISQ